MNKRVAGALIGFIWFIGWLFTIGYAKLLWWQVIIAVVIWPYYLGVSLKAPVVFH